MEERDWLIIKTLYEHKNITKTAKALYLSQPALTARIKQIESLLGVKLIYRGNKGITFTASGERTAIFAVKILNELRAFREELANISHETAGVLRIAAPAILASYYLPKLLGKFTQLYPKVKFDVTIAQSSDVISLMNTKSLHFGFLRNDFGWNEDERLLLTVNHVCAVATSPFKLEDLPNMVRVDYETDNYYRAFLDKWWQETFNTSPIIGMMVSNLELCKEMVFSGLGYGLLPSILLEGKSDLFSLPLCDKAGNKLERKTWLIYKKEILDINLPRSFYEFMKVSNFSDFQRRL